MNFDTEAMAIALFEMDSAGCWEDLSAQERAEYVSRAGMLIQRYLTRSEERAARLAGGDKPGGSPDKQGGCST